MVETGFVLVGTTLAVLALLTVLAVWLVEKTLYGEESASDDGGEEVSTNDHGDGRPH